MPRTRYRAVARAARRFFVATGIPVPRFARRAHRALGASPDDDRPHLRKDVKVLRREVEALHREVEALRQRVDRVETAEYRDSIGRELD